MPRTKKGQIFTPQTKELTKMAFSHIEKHRRPLKKRELQVKMGLTATKMHSLVQSWRDAADRHPKSREFPVICGAHWWGTHEQAQALYEAGWSNGRAANGQAKKERGITHAELVEFFQPKFKPRHRDPHPTPRDPKPTPEPYQGRAKHFGSEAEDFGDVASALPPVTPGMLRSFSRLYAEKVNAAKTAKATEPQTMNLSVITSMVTPVTFKVGDREVRVSRDASGDVHLTLL